MTQNLFYGSTACKNLVEGARQGKVFDYHSEDLCEVLRLIQLKPIGYVVLALQGDEDAEELGDFALNLQRFTHIKFLWLYHKSFPIEGYERRTLHTFIDHAGNDPYSLVSCLLDTWQGRLQSNSAGSKNEYSALAIGISTGGPDVLTSLLPELCKIVEVPIFVVQHIPKGHAKFLVQKLEKLCEHTVVEVDHAMDVKSKHVYIATGGCHMAMRQGALKQCLVDAIDGEPVEGCRPSIDLFFETMEKYFPFPLVGLIMTGMGVDGTQGLLKLQARGDCHIIAQDEASSEVWGMPKSAIDAGVTQAVLGLSQIPDYLKNLTFTKE